MGIFAQQRSTTPRVPLLDLKLQYQEIETEVMQAIHEVCAGQAFILGARVEDPLLTTPYYSKLESHSLITY